VAGPAAEDIERFAMGDRDQPRLDIAINPQPRICLECCQERIAGRILGIVQRQ
jgi:hypothetical protein